MIRTIDTEKKTIKLWLEDIDHDTLEQARNLANHPFVYHHVAIMPDAHVGYGMPIGGVAATEDVIIPNAVGVDIGCGVCAVQTSLHHLARPQLKKIIQAVRQAIPLGFKHHTTAQPHEKMPRLRGTLTEKEMPVIHREYGNGRLQLGTLGGGNHFIELQRGDDNCIWLMIHSGSRNIGYQVAGHYNRLAIAYNQAHGTKIPPKWQLDCLPMQSDAGQNYLREMHYCVQFAAANRQAMMHKVSEILLDFEPSVTFSPALDVAHNYASLEDHFGKKVYVHRKGATRAAAGQAGIISGSQGSTSYIVRGLGNRESFCSCSHGAGRKLGRKQAQRQLDLQEEIRHLEQQGIVHSIRHKKDLDEAAGAYKNIDEVMNNQRDLIEIVTTLKPLAVVKG